MLFLLAFLASSALIANGSLSTTLHNPPQEDACLEAGASAPAAACQTRFRSAHLNVLFDYLSDRSLSNLRAYTESYFSHFTGDPTGVFSGLRELYLDGLDSGLFSTSFGSLVIHVLQVQSSESADNTKIFNVALYFFSFLNLLDDETASAHKNAILQTGSIFPLPKIRAGIDINPFLVFPLTAEAVRVIIRAFPQLNTPGLCNRLTSYGLNALGNHPSLLAELNTLYFISCDILKIFCFPDRLDVFQFPNALATLSTANMYKVMGTYNWDLSREQALAFLKFRGRDAVFRELSETSYFWSITRLFQDSPYSLAGTSSDLYFNFDWPWGEMAYFKSASLADDFELAREVCALARWRQHFVRFWIACERYLHNITLAMESIYTEISEYNGIEGADVFNLPDFQERTRKHFDSIQHLVDQRLTLAGMFDEQHWDKHKGYLGLFAAPLSAYLRTFLTSGLQENAASGDFLNELFARVKGLSDAYSKGSWINSASLTLSMGEALKKLMEDIMLEDSSFYLDAMFLLLDRGKGAHPLDGPTEPLVEALFALVLNQQHSGIYEERVNYFQELFPEHPRLSELEDAIMLSVTVGPYKRCFEQIEELCLYCEDALIERPAVLDTDTYKSCINSYCSEYGLQCKAKTWIQSLSVPVLLDRILRPSTRICTAARQLS
jgi:hypothetical protein